MSTHEHFAGEFEGAERLPADKKALHEHAVELGQKAKDEPSDRNMKAAIKAHTEAGHGLKEHAFLLSSGGDKETPESSSAKGLAAAHFAEASKFKKEMEFRPNAHARAQVAAREKEGEAKDIENAIATQRARLSDPEGYGSKLPSAEQAAEAKVHIASAESSLRLGKHREARGHLSKAKVSWGWS